MVLMLNDDDRDTAEDFLSSNRRSLKVLHFPDNVLLPKTPALVPAFR